MLRLLAAVKVVVFGVVSKAGALLTDVAGVVEVCLLGRVDGSVLGSTDTAADLREGGREEIAGGGVVTSGFVATRGTLVALTVREGKAGVGVGETALGCEDILSFKGGILMMPALWLDDEGCSGIARGEGLGKIFCFFFGCNSGSLEGVADFSSSNFLFFGSLLSAFAGVFAGAAAGGVVVVAVFKEASAVEKGLVRLKRFLIVEPKSPKLRAASSVCCAARVAASFCGSSFFSFLESVLFKDLGLDGTSVLGVALAGSGLAAGAGGGGGGFSLFSMSRKGVPLALAVARAL